MGNAQLRSVRGAHRPYGEGCLEYPDLIVGAGPAGLALGCQSAARIGRAAHRQENRSQDAINLAWKLARVIDGAPAELLDTYEERRAHAREVLRATDQTTTVFFAPSVVARALRDWIVLPLLCLGTGANVRQAVATAVHYRHSRLSRNDRSSWVLAYRLACRRASAGFASSMAGRNRAHLADLPQCPVFSNLSLRQLPLFRFRDYVLLWQTWICMRDWVTSLRPV